MTRRIVRRVLLAAGLYLFVFDVVRLSMTGVALAGVVLLWIALVMYGALTRSFWLTDDELDQRPEAVEQGVKR